MISGILGITIVIVLFTILVIVSWLNQNYKKDVNVRGFVGNCEKCSSFSCHKHPQHEGYLEEVDD